MECCLIHHFKRRLLLLHEGKTILKIAIGRKDDTQQILDKGDRIFLTIVPACLRLPKCIVVKIFVFCNLGFQ